LEGDGAEGAGLRWQFWGSGFERGGRGIDVWEGATWKEGQCNVSNQLIKRASKHMRKSLVSTAETLMNFVQSTISKEEIKKFVGILSTAVGYICIIQFVIHILTDPEAPSLKAGICSDQNP
jgi:hypothetical protein